ncbi:TetR/AcrR family transcriptional regulator [Rhodococcus spongiicola]|uniref:TetR/AcrR family transcriptional regulator n=1 Tax=Rhodococcus spongiicola TaxID=2487352 RepID=A0A3S3E668_9NOCA|nr:helix-turn-helix domain-containing protein [Rhodococcus spongiicola]RVW06677.1 TetR/AcrR family transcriptional regulator [Rhodococcus spongiicola]
MESSSATAKRLLEAALAIIDRDGIDALTVRSLVAESGVSNGSVYHHVGSLDRVEAAAADEAIRAWSAAFLAALERGGYAAAAAADRTWSRAHPGLAALIERNGQRGELGPAARDFGIGLRAWLDSRRLAIDAPAQVVAAVLLGPLAELRRLEKATGRMTRKTDFEALEAAVINGLKSLGSNLEVQH